MEEEVHTVLGKENLGSVIKEKLQPSKCKARVPCWSDSFCYEHDYTKLNILLT